eukprot:2313132-Alexandrium_andersonii.AAC.1
MHTHTHTSSLGLLQTDEVFRAQTSSDDPTHMRIDGDAPNGVPNGSFGKSCVSNAWPPLGTIALARRSVSNAFGVWVASCFSVMQVLCTYSVRHIIRPGAKRQGAIGPFRTQLVGAP